MNDNKKIFFGTKEENNQRRLDEALARTPHERLIFFLKMNEELLTFTHRHLHPNDIKNNFIVE